MELNIIVKKGRTAVRRRSPSVEKTAQTKRAILSAATEVFLARGFSDARMEDIASRASVAKGLLYIYYPNKISLFESVVGELAAEPLSNLDRFRPEAGESVRSFMLRNVRPLLRDFGNSRRGALIRLVLGEGARIPAVGDIYRRLAFEPLLKAIRQALLHAQANGELRSDALVRFPELLTAPALFSAVGRHVLQDHRASSPEELFAALIDAFFIEKA